MPWRRLIEEQEYHAPIIVRYTPQYRAAAGKEERA
jgi:hypothetical protein